ncbi:MAG: T9SS type A sorting domain-containing protein [Chitinophagales bacterium]
MKHFSTVLTLLLLTVFSSNYEASAQGTWDNIYTILQTNCSTSSCHGTGSPHGDFFVDNSKSVLYDSLINAKIFNNHARDSVNNKLIYPGDPARSFLLRKIAHCMDGDLLLHPDENAPMPENRPALPDSTVEMIRQWILYGAEESGKIHNEELISEYYANPKDHVKRLYPLAPPRECEGFQIHLGPIFLKPNEEVEYFVPYDLGVDDDLEVTKLEVKMNTESHHFILYSLDSANAQNKPKGLRELGADAFGGSFVNAWQNDAEYELPNGTAFFWKKDKVLDLNYHIYNYNSDKILPAEVYLNVYTQPKGTAEKEMKSTLITIDPITSLYIPPSDPNDPPEKVTATFTEEVIRNSLDTVSLFMLSTHTHSWGAGYDIFRRDPAAPQKKGQMLYDGNFDYIKQESVQKYNWEHPPIRFFEPLMPIDMNLGLVHEARYTSLNAHNKEPQGYIPTLGNVPWTSWSFETTGEMMLIYMQYVDGTYEVPHNPLATAQCDASEPFPDADPCDNFIPEDTTGIYDIALDEESVKVYPNPFQGSTNIVVDMPQQADLNIEVYDMLGKRVEILASGTHQSGEHRFSFNSKNASSNGIYFVRVTMNDKSLTKKLIEMQ